MNASFIWNIMNPAHQLEYGTGIFLGEYLINQVCQVSNSIAENSDPDLLNLS